MYRMNQNRWNASSFLPSMTFGDTSKKDSDEVDNSRSNKKNNMRKVNTLAWNIENSASHWQESEEVNPSFTDFFAHFAFTDRVF